MAANLKTSVTLRRAVRELVAAKIEQTRINHTLHTADEAKATWARVDKAGASYERALRKVFDDF
jgi:uncharacterized glyoxalase superfamily protein PhnB